VGHETIEQLEAKHAEDIARIDADHKARGLWFKSVTDDREEFYKPSPFEPISGRHAYPPQQRGTAAWYADPAAIRRSILEEDARKWTDGRTVCRLNNSNQSIQGPKAHKGKKVKKAPTLAFSYILPEQ
jgi:hypothetical protein